MLGAGEAVSGAADGTLRRLTEPLRRGDQYTVRAYAPTPTARQMRAAPGRYDIELSQYTDVVLPAPGENALDTARPRGLRWRRASGSRCRCAAATRPPPIPVRCASPARPTRAPSAWPAA